MNEETEILVGKALMGFVDDADRRRWEALCAADPALRREAGSLSKIADRMREQARLSESTASETAEVPAALIERLESAGGKVNAGGATRRQNEPARVPFSLVAKLSNPVRKLLEFPAPLLAAAAAVAVLAAGWWIWWGGIRTRPVVAVLKDAVVNPDLPILSPGERTFLSDPPIAWMTLDPAPVSVEILSPDEKTVRFQLENAIPPVRWENLVPVEGEGMANPGESLLVRIRQGTMVSERIVRIAEEAHPLAYWLEKGPGDGRQLAESWLNQGRPGDALSLAAALAGAFKDAGEDFSNLRTRALKAALAGTEAKP